MSFFIVLSGDEGSNRCRKFLFLPNTLTRIRILFCNACYVHHPIKQQRFFCFVLDITNKGLFWWVTPYPLNFSRSVPEYDFDHILWVEMAHHVRVDRWHIT